MYAMKRIVADVLQLICKPSWFEVSTHCTKFESFQFRLAPHNMQRHSRSFMFVSFILSFCNSFATNFDARNALLYVKFEQRTPRFENEKLKSKSQISPKKSKRSNEWLFPSLKTYSCIFTCLPTTNRTSHELPPNQLLSDKTVKIIELLFCCVEIDHFSSARGKTSPIPRREWHGIVVRVLEYWWFQKMNNQMRNSNGFPEAVVQSMCTWADLEPGNTYFYSSFECRFGIFSLLEFCPLRHKLNDVEKSQILFHNSIFDRAENSDRLKFNGWNETFFSCVNDSQALEWTSGYGFLYMSNTVIE